jgi:hypothetical protein
VYDYTFQDELQPWVRAFGIDRVHVACDVFDCQVFETDRS